MIVFGAFPLLVFDRSSNLQKLFYMFAFRKLSSVWSNSE